MINKSLRLKIVIVIFLSIGFPITGCKTTPQKPVQLTPAQIKIESGKSHFENGEYGLAEDHFLDETIWNKNDPAQIESLKYLGFIYCVTERISLCRHSFYKALQLDPTFELTTAESTHPLWGPEFLVAQSGLNGDQ